MDRVTQDKRAAKTQRFWAASARKDMNYNMKEYHRDVSQGNMTLAKFHKREADWCRFWMNRRLALAKKYENAAKK